MSGAVRRLVFAADLHGDGAQYAELLGLVSAARPEPPLVLCGHIHEAFQAEGRWAVRLGRTLCINPGRGSRLHAVVIDLDAEGQVLSAEHSVL